MNDALAPIGMILILIGLSILATSLLTSFIMWDWQWFWSSNAGWRIFILSAVFGWGKG